MQPWITSAQERRGEHKSVIPPAVASTSGNDRPGRLRHREGEYKLDTLANTS